MKKSLSKFLSVCLISTMVLSTGCTGKGQQTGNGGVTQAFDSEESLFAEEEGPFFLLSQSSIPDMSEEVILAANMITEDTAFMLKSGKKEA